jgi:hypothetical protein
MNSRTGWAGVPHFPDPHTEPVFVNLLKGQCHEIFCFIIFLESSSTPAANFATSSTDTGGKFVTGVYDTGGKQWEQLSNS